MNYYNLHDIISIKSNIIELPDTFYTRPIKNTDITFISSNLNFDTHDSSRTRNFFYTHTFYSLQMDYKAPFLNTKLKISDLDTRPLIEFTPHLLKYSRVGISIKSLIQLQLLKKGHAMIHAACIEKNNESSLIVSAKDMGKTSTTLALLDNYNFMSDDLTIISENGTSYSYPEPVVITPNTANTHKQFLLNKLFKIHGINQIRERFFNKESYITYNIPTRQITPSAPIKNVFILNTGPTPNISKITQEQAVQKIIATTIDLINPLKEPILNYYAYLCGYDMYNETLKLQHIISSSIANANYYEITSNNIKDFQKYIRSIT